MINEAGNGANTKLLDRFSLTRDDDGDEEEEENPVPKDSAKEPPRLLDDKSISQMCVVSIPAARYMQCNGNTIQRERKPRRETRARRR